MTFTWKAMPGFMLAGLLLGLAAGWWLWCREPAVSPPAPAVEEELRDRHFEAPSGDAPEIPDAPAGTRPVAVVTGAGGFRRAVPPAPAGEPATVDSRDPGTSAGPATAQPPGCGGVFDTVTPEDLAVKCRAEIVTLEGHPFARLFGDAGVQLPGGRQVWRGEGRLEDVKLDWSPPPVPASRPRTLIGVTVGGWADSGGAGPLVGGLLSPGRWAIAMRGAEGRIALVGAVHLGPGGELEGGEVAATLIFGAGRR